MISSSRLFFLGFLLLLAFPLAAQKLDKEDKQNLKEAEYYFGEELYLRALPFFSDLSEKHPEIDELKYKLGICYLYKTNEHEKAKEILTELGQSGASFEDLKFNLGRAHHLLYEFDQAIAYFKEYAEKYPDEDNPNRVKAERYIAFCENGKSLVNDELDVDLLLLKPPSTDEGSEYSPVITPDESVLIYTYRGENSKGGLMDGQGELNEKGQYYEDILISYKNTEDDTWKPAENIGNSINTFGHDAATSISVDGQKLFIYKSDPHSSEDIYMSELLGDKWGFPRKIAGEVNSNSWEGSASLGADGRTLYFSSERPGGFGGRDLYVAELNDKDEWVNKKNLGQTVNTPYDEDCPFIHPDGVNLYYSSSGHTSMGGYDIFHAFKENGVWGEPENIGYPVNTVADDRYYTVSADGERGYFSSAMASGGDQHDLFMVSPGAYNASVLVLVYGEVRLDDKPIEAQIILEDPDTGEILGTYSSNALTGKFTFTAVPGRKYKVSVVVPGQEPYVEYVDIAPTDRFVKVNHNFNLYSFNYKQLNGEKDFLSLQEDIDNALRMLAAADRYAELPPDVTNPDGMSAEDAGLVKLGYPAGMDYTVQIGAYRFPGNFKYAFVAHLGSVRIKAYPDKITRFTMGEFKDLEKAEALRQKLIKEGVEDAWILGLKDGERILLDLDYDENGVLQLEQRPDPNSQEEKGPNDEDSDSDEGNNDPKKEEEDAKKEEEEGDQ
ncbi:MAG: tetratricopeptide repeat protein [Salibacteraceae bacterium]